MKRLIVGWHNGISGPSALASSAASNFNASDEGKDRQIQFYPVTYEATNEVALYVSQSWDPKEKDYEQVKKLLEGQATDIASVINNTSPSRSLIMKRLVAGFNPYNSGRFALAPSAAAAFNKSHKETGLTGLQIEFYPVTFEGDHEPAFHLSYCYKEGDITLEKVREILAKKAALLVEVFNRNLTGLETLINDAESTQANA